jgi:SnoaL-like protein
MIDDARQAVRTYFDSWRTKDFDTLQSVLADDVSFVGPLSQADGAADCRRGIEGMSQIVTDIVVKKVFIDGPDALTWFELHTKHASPRETANWSHVEDGKITRIRVAFDARGFADADR